LLTAPDRLLIALKPLPHIQVGEVNGTIEVLAPTEPV
jgi:hypothetical protein